MRLNFIIGWRGGIAFLLSAYAEEFFRQGCDYPDPDVIRVGNVYYMVSTTMHFFPGAQILRSFDLLHWEHCGYVFDRFGETPAQRLDGGHIYGKGMWAATLRFHAGWFHIVFTCNDTERSYHYAAQRPEGPWTRREINGLYYDPSLLFDDDGRVYIAHGCREIRLTELRPDLSGPLPDGLDRFILRDSDTIMLGWEGSHLQKINGRYYLFTIHWKRGDLRAQGCHAADSLQDTFTGGEIVRDDMDGSGRGVAQGGAIDTPDGRWYLMLFQDHGAQGRMPVLIPMRWENGFPRVEPVPMSLAAGEEDKRRYAPLHASDSLRGALNALWQWNHEPHDALWSVSGEGLRLTTDRVAGTLEAAVNTLTQRCFGPACACEVAVDASSLKNGDYAGLCALMGCYAQLAVTRDESGYMLSLVSREPEDQPYAIEPSPEPVTEKLRAPLAEPCARMRVLFDFSDDTARFEVLLEGGWQPFGGRHRLVYRLDHFMGCRVGLFCYATRSAGGSAVFSDFIYNRE